MAAFYKYPRGPRANLDTLAGSSGLIPYQAYWITDEFRLAIATATNAYKLLPSFDEVVFANNPSFTTDITVNNSAPSVVFQISGGYKADIGVIGNNLIAYSDGEVHLDGATGTVGYYNSSERFRTTSNGVEITGRLLLPASASGGATFNIPHGAAPTSPNNGDIWTTSSGIYARINGITVGPLGTGGGGGGTAQILHIAHTEAQGTAGGTHTGGVDTTRVLNTGIINTISGASLGTNQFTLPAGTYRIFAKVPFYQTNQSYAWLYNVTDSVITKMGTNEYASNTNAGGASSLIVGEFTITGTKTFEIRSRSTSTGTTQGMGVTANVAGRSEVYTQVIIETSSEAASSAADGLGPDGNKGDATVGGAGTTLTINNDAVSDAKLRDSAALSVIGRSANTSGDPADIAAGADHQVLRRSGTALGFGSINLASPFAVTGRLPYANMPQLAQNTVMGRVSSGTGDVEALTASQLHALADAWTYIKTTADFILPNSTTFTSISDGTNTLTFTPPADSDWEMEANILIETPTATNLPRVGVNVGANANNGYGAVNIWQAGATAGTTVAASGTWKNNGAAVDVRMSACGVQTASTPWLCEIKATGRSGSAPQPITIQLGNETAAASMGRALRGSFLKWRTV